MSPRSHNAFALLVIAIAIALAAGLLPVLAEAAQGARQDNAVSGQIGSESGAGEAAPGSARQPINRVPQQESAAAAGWRSCDSRR